MPLHSHPRSCCGSIPSPSQYRQACFVLSPLSKSYWHSFDLEKFGHRTFGYSTLQDALRRFHNAVMVTRKQRKKIGNFNCMFPVKSLVSPLAERYKFACTMGNVPDYYQLMLKSISFQLKRCNYSSLTSDLKHFLLICLTFRYYSLLLQNTLTQQSILL